MLNDNDPPGFAHAETACKLSLGLAKRVRRLDLALDWPEIGKGDDVSDWLDRGGGSVKGCDADRHRARLCAAARGRREAGSERERGHSERGDRETRRVVGARLRAGAQDGGREAQCAR